MPSPPEVHVHAGAKAWDLIWKWIWFSKELWQEGFRETQVPFRKAMESILPQLRVKSVLDCACGLGWKTLVLAEMGYEVEGSDRCQFAVRQAAHLARSEGKELRFFPSFWGRLGETAGRTYDCVFHDAFAMIDREKAFTACAKGVFEVLNEGGVFIFVGECQSAQTSSVDARIEARYALGDPFSFLGHYEKDGVKVLSIMSQVKSPQGIESNRVFMIDERGKSRIEVASVIDPCLWGWADFVRVLTATGFCRVYSVETVVLEGIPYVLNVAWKAPRNEEGPVDSGSTEP